MNQTIARFARQQIVAGLNRLSPNHRHTFALMYGRLGGRRSIADAAAMSVEAIVAEIPDEKLDWALQQVENTPGSVGKP